MLCTNLKNCCKLHFFKISLTIGTQNFADRKSSYFGGFVPFLLTATTRLLEIGAR
jgi:hypothetical protein